MAGDSASPAPLLGTAFLLSQSASSPSATASSSSAAPSSATHTAITPSVCTDYSLFKRLVDQSRRVSDDAITVRLNRAAALGGGAVAGRGAREMGAGECDAVWRELVGRWSERGEALSYCDRVLLEQAAQAKGKTTAQAQGGAGVLGEEEGLSADWERRGRGFADELELKVRSHLLRFGVCDLPSSRTDARRLLAFRRLGHPRVVPDCCRPALRFRSPHSGPACLPSSRWNPSSARARSPSSARAVRHTLWPTRPHQTCRDCWMLRRRKRSGGDGGVGTSAGG